MTQMAWNHQSVLVTGAGGFIGSHLTERLVELGAKTRALDLYNFRNSCGWLDYSPVKKDVEVILGDVCDRDTIRKAMKGVDIVFHLAALIAIPYSYQAPLSYIRTNIEGTFNVLQAALENDVSLVVQTSTSEVYGTAQYVPIDENHPLQGQSPYSASKIGADAMADSFYRSFNLPVTIVRPFNTFGPRQSARAVIPTIITQLLAGKTEIKLGALHPTRDLLFVKDTVNAFVEIAKSDKTIGGEINIATQKEISIQDLAQTIIDLINPSAKIISDDIRLRPEKSEVERLLGSSEKIRSLTNWKAQYIFTDALKQTIEWFRNPENLKNYKTDIYNV